MKKRGYLKLKNKVRIAEAKEEDLKINGQNFGCKRCLFPSLGQSENIVDKRANGEEEDADLSTTGSWIEFR